jgi:hypothetical protein
MKYLKGGDPEEGSSSVRIDPVPTDVIEASMPEVEKGAIAKPDFDNNGTTEGENQFDESCTFSGSEKKHQLSRLVVSDWDHRL